MDNITKIKDEHMENESETVVNRNNHIIFALRKCQNIITSAGWKLLIFIAFLIVLCFVSFGMTTHSQYHLTQALKKTFLDRSFGQNGIQFDSASTVPDIWSFLNDVAVMNLFSRPRRDNFTYTFILQVNLLLGLPRLRQLRVKNDSCTIHDDFRRHINKCYGRYSTGIENKAPFGPGNGTAWRYHSAAELQSSSSAGRLNTYSGGGSYLDLGPGREIARNQLSFLRKHYWISSASRVVFLDFTVYNANVNLFSIVKIMFELPPSGGVWPFSTIHTVKLFRYVTGWDYFIFAFEILFCCLTAYYLIEEIVEIRVQKLSYFKSKWNLMDSTILILSIFVIAFAVYRNSLINEVLEGFLSDHRRYPNFDFISNWQTRYDDSMAILVFISWVKVFKYLSFNITMQQLSTTLTKCAKDVGGFAVMFFIVFLAYAQLGYLLFGTQLHDFSRVHTSFFTLLVIILGDFDYSTLVHANSIMGPIFFFTYVFFVFFILMNMFLAILSDTYTNVKAEMEQEDDDKFQCGGFLKKIYNKLRNIIFRRSPNTVEAPIENTDEIEMDNNEEVSDEMRHQVSEQVRKRIVVSEHLDASDSKADISVEDFVRLSNRVDDLHHEVEQFQLKLVSKLVIVIEKLKILTLGTDAGD